MNHIDIELINQNMFDNPELIKQFVSMYLIQTPVDLDKLRQALSEGDLQKVGDAAHHIKPTMDYIGAFHLNKISVNSRNIKRNLFVFQSMELNFIENNLISLTNR